ncbi:hypothetical protein PR048_017200 [Dryococelus australis]|uniref:Uncharacterized protein n=1 Tax=Dryococelus australis TaxID=614101 RepID=A0ABQ9H8X0_9NEOP|nr:hypothetical protein PR048_017200 [Dryococelus australis]
MLASDARDGTPTFSADRRRLEAAALFLPWTPASRRWTPRTGPWRVLTGEYSASLTAATLGCVRRGAVARKPGMRSACSPPTKTNLVQSPLGSQDFLMWESCRTLSLVGGFSRGSHVSLALSFRRCYIHTSITLIGSKDVALNPHRNSTAGETGRSPRKPSDQLHCPAGFQHAKIRERPRRESNPFRLGGRRTLYPLRRPPPPPLKPSEKNFHHCCLPPRRTRFNLQPVYSGFLQVGIVPDDLLISGFSRGSPVFSALSFRRCSTLTSLHPHRLSRRRCYAPPKTHHSLFTHFHFNVGDLINYRLFTLNEVSMEQRRNERACETGDPRENPPTSGIVRYDPHLRKCGVNLPGWEATKPGEQANRSATAAPLVSQTRSKSVHSWLPGLQIRERRSNSPTLSGFHTWESCRTMPLAGGFSRGFPVSPAASYSPRFTLIGPPDPMLRAAQVSSLTLSLMSGHPGENPTNDNGQQHPAGRDFRASFSGNVRSLELPEQGFDVGDIIHDELMYTGAILVHLSAYREHKHTSIATLAERRHLPRSHDLNPLGFYLWGHLKTLVYATRVNDVDSLRKRIVANCVTIRNFPGIHQRIRVSMQWRVDTCVHADGGHFVHIV